MTFTFISTRTQCILIYIVIPCEVIYILCYLFLSSPSGSLSLLAEPHIWPLLDTVRRIVVLGKCSKASVDSLAHANPCCLSLAEDKGRWLCLMMCIFDGMSAGFLLFKGLAAENWEFIVAYFKLASAVGAPLVWAVTTERDWIFTSDQSREKIIYLSGLDGAKDCYF